MIQYLKDIQINIFLLLGILILIYLIIMILYGWVVKITHKDDDWYYGTLDPEYGYMGDASPAVTTFNLGFGFITVFYLAFSGILLKDLGFLN